MRNRIEKLHIRLAQQGQVLPISRCWNLDLSARLDGSFSEFSFKHYFQMPIPMTAKGKENSQSG